MSLRTMLIGIFALVFGLAAAAGAYLVTRERAPAPEIEMLPVLVAGADVPRGQSLTEDLIERRRWPKESVPEGALTNPSEALDRTVLVPLAKGDLLLDAKLAAKGAGRGLAAIIPPGMRAVTIQTPNIATGVAGFILPGNKVDVLLTVSGQRLDDPTGGGSTFVLLQDVEILAVDQRIDAPQGNKVDPKELRSVTLLVTPADAAKLELGQNKGTLHLALRNPGDEARGFVEPATLSGLHSHLPGGASATTGMPAEIPEHPAEEAELARKPRSLPSRVRTLRGTESSEVEFQSHRETKEQPLLDR